MARPKLYTDDFTNERRLGWVRFLAQCRYRNETVDLTFEQYCHFWRDPQQWQRRGRNPDDLVLTRFDPNKSWSKTNCCIISRRNQLNIRNYRKFNKDVQEYYAEALIYES